MAVIPSDPVVAIVVAAGSGSRLGGGLPKALREVAGVPLVTRSVERLAAGGVDAAIVVVPPGRGDEFAQALAGSSVPCHLVVGGAERQASVQNGLVTLRDDADLADARVVLVHDAARAFVPPAVVRRVVDAVRAGARAVVPVVDVVDSIREVHQAGSRVVDRTTLRAVQTPQGFDRGTLLAAHALVLEHGIRVTDDAAACEFAGHEVTLVEGDREAIKVTEPLDLLVAEAIARNEGA